MEQWKFNNDMTLTFERWKIKQMFEKREIKRMFERQKIKRMFERQIYHYQVMTKKWQQYHLLVGHGLQQGAFTGFYDFLVSFFGRTSSLQFFCNSVIRITLKQLPYMEYPILAKGGRWKRWQRQWRWHRRWQRCWWQWWWRWWCRCFPIGSSGFLLFLVALLLPSSSPHRHTSIGRYLYLFYIYHLCLFLPLHISIPWLAGTIL